MTEIGAFVFHNDTEPARKNPTEKRARPYAV